MKQIRKNWHRGALIIILALTGFLSFYSIGNEGYGNQYYAAAVKSMLQSGHNFFFASFDPGGYVTVDKPALGLWLQALSALVFGFHGWSLILPEALSAVVSTALTYHIVQKFFGKTAGLASAMVFGLTPIVIAVGRTNNLDSSLLAVLLLAAWALVKASEKGSLGLLLLSMVLAGLGFNIKMLQAFMILPAFYLVYLFTAPLKMRKRILQLAGGTAVLLAVSLSWALTVDLTPEESRPYVGGSRTNSVIELALEYNGIQRVTGRESRIFGDRAGSGNDGIERTPPGEAAQGDGNGALMQGPPDGATQGNDGVDQSGRNYFDGGGQTGSGGNPGVPGGGPGGRSPGMNMGRGPGGTGENGNTGVLRIFNRQLAGQISWLLPMAFFGILVFLMKLIGRNTKDKKKILRYLLLWAGWIFPMLIYFSIAGFFHRYYLVMLAPGIAALAGAGMVELWRLYMKSGWKWVLLPSALVVSGGLQAVILSRYPDWELLINAVCGMCFIAAIGLIVIRVLKKDNMSITIRVLVTAGFVALLAAPALWAYTPMVYGSQTTLPIAGPELASGGNPGAGSGQDFVSGTRNTNNTSRLVEFLQSKRQGEKYLAAVADANSAAPIIIQTGEPVMAVGGFAGSDPILTVERLEQMVKDGQLRYFQIGGRGMGRNSDITNWVAEHGQPVPADQWRGTEQDTGDAEGRNGGGFPGGMGQDGATLYDLAPEKG